MPRQEETREPGRYSFHYSREERLNAASEQLKRRLGPQSFFRKYRGPLFILLDVLVLAGMFGIYLFLTGDQSTVGLPGYAVTMSGVEFGAQGLVVVRITQLDEHPSFAGSIVTAEVSLDGTDLSAAEKDVMPTRKGRERIFRFVLEPLPGTKTSQSGASSGASRGSRNSFQVTGTVTVEDQSRTLHAPLKPE
ncbi:hypothetical protein [Salinispira pacifica]